MSAISPERWSRLAPLLDDALDRSGAARVSWLAALRARAPDDAHDVERLLGADVTSWLATAHRQGVLGTLAEDPAAAGVTLGPWTLERPLGVGGMGTVWLASRTDGRFSGHAAVKLLHPSLALGEGAIRFRREGEVLARLSHPGIARLYDAGVSDAGQPYLVLEYVNGLPIDRWCDDQQLSVEQILTLFEQVCAAVAHAHAHGVVHQDLKPSNLYVTHDGAVKLLDFGIAQLAGDETASAHVASAHVATVQTASADTTLAPAAAPYTPRYAAPEQVTDGDISTATDIYALGVVLYELLGNEHPTPVVTGGLPEIIAAITGHTPAPLHSRIPRDINAIVQCALRKAPADRYGTVAAMAEDLRRYRRHEPVAARGDGSWYRVRRFARRHRAGLLAAGVAATALLGSAVVSANQAVAARRQRDLALVAERRARVMSEVLLSLLAEVPTVDTLARAVEGIRRTRVLLDSYLADDDRERARLALNLARQFITFARVTEADSLLYDALRYAESANDAALTAEARCVAGARRGLSPEDAASEFTALRASLPADAWRARAACNMTESRRLMMRFAGDSASLLAQEAVELAESAGDTVSLFYAMLLHDQSAADAWSSLDYAVKVQRYRRVLSVYDRLGLGQSAPAMQVTRGLASLSREKGRIMAGDATAQAMLAPLERGERWRGVPPSLLLEQAQLAHLMGRAEDAERWFARTITLLRRPDAMLLQIRARQLYARTLADVGHVAAARAQLDSLDQLLAVTSNSAFEAGRVRVLAALYAAEGQPHRAAALLDSMLRSRGYPERPKIVEWSDLLLEYARIQFAVGNRDDARRAIELTREVFDEDSVSVNGSYRFANLQLLDAQLLAAAADTSAAAAAASDAHRSFAVAVGPDHQLTSAAAAYRDSLRPPHLASTAASDSPPNGPHRRPSGTQ